MTEVSVGNTASGSDQECSSGVRVIVLNLPEDEGEGLGFRLTRTLWDPYPWLREVTPKSRADAAGLKAGDCLLQADGRDLLGLPVSQVAGLIRGDGAGGSVTLMAWNCGVDPKDDPELLWSCGGGYRGERSRRALTGVVRALACCVCAATAVRALSCARSHLYCEGCWARLERCALCRENLPPKDSPYARNLVAEQVFEAIATEYEIKDTIKKPTETVSAYTSPNRSPSMSPSINRKGQYQLSMMQRKKTVQFNEKFGPSYASDPNIHRSTNNQECTATRPLINRSTTLVENTSSGNTNNATQYGGQIKCNCQSTANDAPKQSCSSENVSKADAKEQDSAMQGCCAKSCHNLYIQHKLVTRLRPACSLVDLQNATIQSCGLSRSLNNIDVGNCTGNSHHSGSLDDLKTGSVSPCESPVLLLSAPPIYVLTCDHKSRD